MNHSPLRSLRTRLLGMLAVVLVAVPGGDVVAGDTVPESDLAPLIQSYNRWAAGLRTVRAGGRARVGQEGEPTRAFDFSMVLSRPGQVRVQGRWGSVATLFDLNTAPGEGWTLYLPRDRAVVRAGAAGPSPGLLLPPMEIVSVLLPAGIPPRDVSARGTATQDEDRIRLVVPPGMGGAGSPFHRVIWVDPRDGRPLRLEIRNRNQLEAPILTAVYEEYEGRGGEAFPVRVSVTLSPDRSWTRFWFETVRINETLAPQLFELRIPEGTREMSPEELTPEFLPTEEG